MVYSINWFWISDFYFYWLSSTTIADQWKRYCILVSEQSRNQGFPLGFLFSSFVHPLTPLEEKSIFCLVYMKAHFLTVSPDTTHGDLDSVLQGRVLALQLVDITVEWLWKTLQLWKDEKIASCGNGVIGFRAFAGPEPL